VSLKCKYCGAPKIRCECGEKLRLGRLCLSLTDELAKDLEEIVEYLYEEEKAVEILRESKRDVTDHIGLRVERIRLWLEGESK
jgi:hypothetical protein